jgi:hypothetical protein
MLVALIAGAAIVGAGCSSDGVSEAEYDQKVAELALAQQDLYDATDAASTAKARTAEIEDRIDRLAVEAELALDPGDDPLDVVVETINAGREEVLYLSTELERALAAGDAAPPPGTPLDTRLAASLDVAATTTDWLRPGNLPESEQLVELADAVASTEDEDVRLAYEVLLEGYDNADSEGQVGLIAELDYWAVDNASALVLAG